MKRLHVHVSVDDLAQSIRFYSTLFAAEPTVVKDDYAKWMLEDPRVNFAISRRVGERAGISHLASRPRIRRSSPKFTTASPAPNARLSRRRPPPAAMPNPTSSGSPTRRACRGRPSSPMVRPRSTAKAHWGDLATQPNPRAARRAAAILWRAHNRPPQRLAARPER